MKRSCGHSRTHPAKISNEILEDFETDFLNFSEGSIGETTAEEKFRKSGQKNRNIAGNFGWMGSNIIPQFNQLKQGLISEFYKRTHHRNDHHSQGGF